MRAVTQFTVTVLMAAVVLAAAAPLVAQMTTGQVARLLAENNQGFCQVGSFKADSTPRYGLTAHPRAPRYWGAIRQLDSCAHQNASVTAPCPSL